MILFGLRDIGPSNACLPVIKIFKEKNIPTAVYAEGAAAEYLKNKTTFVVRCDIDNLLDSTKPKLVVVTPSTPTPDYKVPTCLTDQAKKRNIMIVFVEDNWSGHSSSPWNALPDVVCVADKFAENLILKSWPDFLQSRIYVTGAPVFDKFVNVDIEAARHNLRTALSLNVGWPVIFFPGEVYGMTTAVPMFIQAVNDLDVPVCLVLRDHPKVVLSDAPEEFKKIRLQNRRDLESLTNGVVADSALLTSDEVNAGCDLAVGICSTMLTEACYMRKPTLHIWTSEIGRELFKVAKNTFAELPTTNLGAAWKVESVEEIKTSLQKILAGDTIEMRAAQEKHFRADGLNGQRLAEAILRYYK